MKKIFAILLALVLFVSVLSITAMADGTAALGTDGKYTVCVGAGNTVTVNVYLGNNPGIGAMRFGFNYDASMLTLQSVQGVGMSGGNWTVNDYALWDGGADSSYNGQILKLTFALTDAAKVGDIANVSVYCIDAWSFDNGEVTIGGSMATVEVICNHNWELTSTKPSTCTEDGEKLYTCSICGETKTEAIAATSHSWDNGVVTKEPTCTVEGVKTITCTKCGETKTEAVATVPHSWDNGVVTKEPTCTVEGVKTITCTMCGETKTEAIAAGHSFNEDKWENDENEHWHGCKFCDATCCKAAHEMVPVEKLDPKPGKAGYEISQCTVCGYRATKYLGALDPELPDEPKVGDIRPMMMLGFTGILFVLAAGVYVFKRKSVI